MPTMLLSENVSVNVVFSSISIRPVLPRLMIALDPGPATIELPETIVAFETADCPLTLTCPTTVISAEEAAGTASTTIE
jgi:hypothetical protein